MQPIRDGKHLRYDRVIQVMETVVVVGSLNMDLVAQVPHLPQRGETIAGFQFQMLPGGKGANQACAVGRLGGQARMIGRIGEDVFGERLRSSLSSAGVDVSGVMSTPGESTGVALILVETGGQNQIVVAAGANGQLSPDDVHAELQRAPGQYLLLQLESPLHTVEAAARQGRLCGMSVILDPAPAMPLSSSLLGNIDVLTPNESEALVLLGDSGTNISLDQAPAVCTKLLGLCPSCVILKLGERGAWLADRKQSTHFPAPRVEARDTTAAGDTFNGALVTALAEGKPLERAIHFANCAAALSVTRVGAQASIPSRREVEEVFAASGWAVG
jgi:ribokinase